MALGEKCGNLHGCRTLHHQVVDFLRGPSMRSDPAPQFHGGRKTYLHHPHRPTRTREVDGIEVPMSEDKGFEVPKLPAVAHGGTTPASAERFKVTGPYGQSDFDQLCSATVIARIDEDEDKDE